MESSNGVDGVRRTERASHRSNARSSRQAYSGLLRPALHISHFKNYFYRFNSRILEGELRFKVIESGRKRPQQAYSFQLPGQKSLSNLFKQFRREHQFCNSQIESLRPSETSKAKPRSRVNNIHWIISTGYRDAEICEGELKSFWKVFLNENF